VWHAVITPLGEGTIVNYTSADSYITPRIQVDMPCLGAVGHFQPAVVSQITYVSHSYKRQCDCMEGRGSSEIIRLRWGCPKVDAREEQRAESIQARHYGGRLLVPYIAAKGGTWWINDTAGKNVGFGV
jgi:hypothetical protein